MQNTRMLILLIPHRRLFFHATAIVSFTGAAERCIMAPPLPCTTLPRGFLDCLSIVHGGLFPLGHVPTESDVGQVFNGWRYLGSFMGDKWFEPPPSMGARCRQMKKARRELEAVLAWRVRHADVKAAPRRRPSPLVFTRPPTPSANLD